MNFDPHLYYIVNCADRPYERLIAKLNNGRLYYINEELQKNKNYSAGFALDGRETKLIDFGLDLKLVDEDPTIGLIISANWDRESTAKYTDGKPRQWQGGRSFCFTDNLE